MRLFRSIATLSLVLLAAASVTNLAEARSTRYRNSAPTISGTPAATTTVGIPYSFQPTAVDANGDTLTFSISNKPAWANFTSKGLLSGTPTTAGTYANIVISVSDGKSTRSLAAFGLTVLGSKSASLSSSTNTAPAISGTPITSATVGKPYSFTPTSSDANGDALGFGISNKPAWATFSTATGQLTGTPAAANAGSYTGISISVSDGKTSTSLPAFSMTVVAAATTATGSATISWTPPTTNVDGSTLTNLARYKIYYGTSSNNLSNSVSVSNGVAIYVIDNLPSGTWYFAISAINSSGVESSLSGTANKSI